MTATSVGNRGLALQSLGRLDQAHAAFDLECQLAIAHGDEFSEMHCLAGKGSLSIQTGELEGAQESLRHRVTAIADRFPVPGLAWTVRAAETFA